MPVSASSPADVLNLALRRMGHKKRVASLLDGSEAASAALDLYGQTRDVMIRDGDWQFCSRTINATLLKTAPDNYFDTPWTTANPPLPWRFTYEYPTDCLKVRQLKPPYGFAIPNMLPLATLFSTINDPGYDTPRRVIATNVENAILVYAGQVTDPTQWPSDFTEALAAALAIRLKRSLVADIATVDVADVQGATAAAMAEEG